MDWELRRLARLQVDHRDPEVFHQTRMREIKEKNKASYAIPEKLKAMFAVPVNGDCIAVYNGSKCPSILQIGEGVLLEYNGKPVLVRNLFPIHRIILGCWGISGSQAILKFSSEVTFLDLTALDLATLLGKKHLVAALICVEAKISLPEQCSAGAGSHSQSGQLTHEVAPNIGEMGLERKQLFPLLLFSDVSMTSQVIESLLDYGVPDRCSG